MDWSRKESVVAERFIRILKDKIYEKMAANGSKSYLGYLNKLVDEKKKYLASFYLLKSLLVLIILLLLMNLKWVIKLLNLKLMIESEYKSILGKVTLKNYK